MFENITFFLAVVQCAKPKGKKGKRRRRLKCHSGGTPKVVEKSFFEHGVPVPGKELQHEGRILSAIGGPAVALVSRSWKKFLWHQQ